MSQSSELTAAEVRKVARLARLALSDQQVEAYRTSLSAVLGYVERLRELDLEGVEPMAHPSDATNRLAADEPGAPLSTEVLMGMAPDREEPFIKVPKVLGDDGGA